MVGTLGQPPRSGDLGPGRLVLLGLAVSMVSFAGFRMATDTKPERPQGAQTETLFSASVPSPIPSILFPSLSSSDPVNSQTRTTAVSAPEPAAVPAPPVHQVSSLSVPPPVEAVGSLSDIPEFRDIEHRFAAGETFAEVLARNGVSNTNASAWIKAASRIYALSQIRDGQVLSMRVDVASADLVSMKMDIDIATYLVARRKDGAVVADRESVEFGRVRRVVEGVIESSFYASAARADVPDETIAEVAEVLGWDLDFEKLQPGAKFNIQFEELRNPDGAGTIPGQLLSVRIVEPGGEKHEGIWFQQAGEKSGNYYTSKGQALGRTFLRFPVSFTRISSGFTTSRVHPILNRARPHFGVDLAAPTGTPVHAVADGKIEMAAWHGGNGRWVQIRHDDVYESGYGHLSRIANGIRPGVTVQKGQVIGYVGSTGLSTGPHLHFAMYKNEQYIDPLGVAAPRASMLSATSAIRFKDVVRKVDAAYAAAERAGGNLVLAASASSTTAPTAID
jgi:murein DD-endopeptidase MepM/ murein hydrolase activator NlpD